MARGKDVENPPQAGEIGGVCRFNPFTGNGRDVLSAIGGSASGTTIRPYNLGRRVVPPEAGLPRARSAPTTGME